MWTHTMGIPGRGPIIGGMGGGIIGMPPICMGGIGAEMCGAGATLFCMSLGVDVWLFGFDWVGLGLVGSSVWNTMNKWMIVQYNILM